MKSAEIAKKLQLKEGQHLRVLEAPKGFSLDMKNVGNGEGALLVFALNKAELMAHESEIVKSARADRLTWVAYPKAGQLGTDLNRDILVRRLDRSGVQGVRMISIDEIWSALRLRPIMKR